MDKGLSLQNAMRSKFPSRLAWALFAIASGLTVMMKLVELFTHSRPVSLVNLLVSFLTAWLAIGFTFVAALILSRQQGHTVGWLLMASGTAAAFLGPVEGYVNALPGPPSAPETAFLWLVWIQQWTWLTVVFPLLLIPLHFPNGHPPSPRWSWVVYLALGLSAFYLFIVTFSVSLTATTTGWRVSNPIGFLPDTFANAWGLPFSIGLALLTLGSVAALLVRYRGSAPVERQQIKWLLFACSLFAAYYLLAPNATSGIWSFFFVLLMLTIPASIGMAILRYRLYDIDLIIRRTLVYSLLTALLGLLYFGSITVLQGIFSVLGGAQTTLITVISTLAIYALSNPLRRRVQNFIDRRFYRRKYDAEQVLAAFAASARSETDLERLIRDLLTGVQETVQPEVISLWVQKKHPASSGSYDSRRYS